MPITQKGKDQGKEVETMSEKMMTLITKEPSSGRKSREQLEYLLDNCIHIKRYSIQEDKGKVINTPLLLVSSPSIVEEVKSSFIIKPDTKTIVARRSLSKKAIKTLLELPKGIRCMLYTGDLSYCYETINLIRYLGITEVELVPETPALDNLANVDMIITLDRPEISKLTDIPIINIGIRSLDITTLVEILMFFGLLEEKASTVSAKYTKEIIDLSRELTVALKQNDNIRSELEVLVNANQDGMVMVDEDECVLIMNNAAASLFRLDKSTKIGKKLCTDNGFPWDFSKLANVKNVIMPFNKRRLMIDTMPVYASSGKVGTVATFRDITVIQELEEIVRKDLAQKGHVIRYSFEDIIGVSKEIMSTIQLARNVSKSDAPILIQGESGVGKEMFAQAIHSTSNRNKGPFVGVNFSALPESLLESELFGYEEGAFTGAMRGGRPGLFEAASGGTIFLDEIGDATPLVQTRLLRVLQEKEVMRVGSVKLIPVDVRVIAATNKDMLGLVKSGRFRDDLFYRLNIIPLKVPPLRQRKGDIRVLLNYLCKKKGRRYKFTEKVWDVLELYDWPGNIRELSNLIEYLCCIKDDDSEIELKDLGSHIQYNCGVLDPMGHEDLCEKLESVAPLEEFINILGAVKSVEDSGQHAGRRSLCEITGLTEARIRQRLKVLGSMGLVGSTPGRGGTRITSRGKEFLQSLDPPSPQSGALNS